MWREITRYTTLSTGVTNMVSCRQEHAQRDQQ
jgi:hypothetical protein